MEAQGSETEFTEETRATVDNVANISGSSKGSEIENLDNIKKFIEAQEKNIQDKNNDKNVDVHNMVHPDENAQSVNENSAASGFQGALVDLDKDLVDFEKLVENVGKSAENPEKLYRPTEDVIIPVQNDVDETMAVASSVMEMILSKTETQALGTENVKHGPNPIINSVSENTSMHLSVGSKVEAKDFSEDWYSVQIAEVDYDEMEVLVHYDSYLRKPDEWINVSSPRLRPFTGITAPKPQEKPPEVVEVKVEPKEEGRSKGFVVGERCLARWRDNRRFVATIDKELGDGKFEVIFDDGFRWPCTSSRLSKLKEQRDALTIDSTLPPVACSPPPILQGGPTTVPTYHTHLFDPTRDYLGSKSERREMKRKLNIKEIFNIGQKKYKMSKIEKVPKEKVKKVVKPKVKAEAKIEMQGLPDAAVASIIGTVSTSQIRPQIKDELMDLDLYNMDRPDDSSDSKSDLDPIDKEDKLERFDKPDQFVHNQVIDKMKEAISKLECGLKEEIEKLHSPVRYDSPKTITNLKLEITSPKPGDLSTSESPKLLADLLKQDIASPKKEILSPKLQLPILTPSFETESANSFNAFMKHGSETPTADVEEQITKTTNPAMITDIETDVYPFDAQETQVAVANESAVGIEVSIVDVPSPSLIEEADFNIVPDDDSTKSDIEMGSVSPRLDIDSQPILIDIDAPIDIDEPQSNQDFTLGGTKKLKIKLKNFAKPKKKIKREQKRKLLHKKWEEVDRVKTELAEMKIKMKEMLQKIEREKQGNEGEPLPESCLLPNEWACHWVNGQPLGKVSEMHLDLKPDATGKLALPRRSVEVFDKRLPAGWTKHMVRRSVGHSAGKWDIVLIGPSNRRFHTKLDMRHFLEVADEHTKSYEHALMDFGIHLKLARKLGWVRTTPDGIAEAPEAILLANSQSSLSPLVKRKALALKKPAGLKKEKKKRSIKMKLQRKMHTYNSELVDIEGEGSSLVAGVPEPGLPVLEDGYVWVGSLKVQVIENLLRCPAEGCLKNFRNNALLSMHIKHYHRDMRSMLGAAPKVLDLAAARSKPPRLDSKMTKAKTNKPPKRDEYYQDVMGVRTPPREPPARVPRSQDSPKLRLALNKPVKRPRVLLPVRRVEDQSIPELPEEDIEASEFGDAPGADILDFETAISTHTVTKPADRKKKFATFSKQISEDEEWFANSDDVDTRSSFPRSATPEDSKTIDPKTGLMSSDPMDEQMDPALYTFTENGQRIKIVHMKREEIINCHCGFREEDGLMVQCELCLCWQHAHCHNIQKESEVPVKYTCSICLNPRRGRRSMRHLHDQDRMYQGLLPGAKQNESLRRSHELAGNLLRIEDALHALRVKYYVATKKDHPKLYLWAKDWEQTEMTQKLNSEYSDLTVMINGMRDKDQSKLGTPTGSADEQIDSDRCSRGDSQLGSQALLSGLLSSPSTASLELPISTSELERLARTVQEAAEAGDTWQTATGGAPQPEAAIDNDVCRSRLLKHLQRCQAALDSRLDSIEAQVAELESQEPSFGEHYETAEHYPRVKQTVQLLMRDLDAMHDLGVIT